MTANTPPRFAAWILEHLTPASSGGQPLVGDLHEEFCRGRSRAWYWRQTLLAVLIGYLAAFDRLRVALFFALLWSAATPLIAFEWYTSWPGHELFVRTVPYPWPWSACAQLGIAFALMMSLLGTGFFLYLLLHALVVRHIQRVRPFRALLFAAAVYLAAASAAAAIACTRQPVLHHNDTITLTMILLAPQALFLDVPVALALFVSIAVAYPAPAGASTSCTTH